MSRTTRRRRRIRRLLILAAPAVALAIAAPAQAVVPGVNGRIAYVLGPGGGEQATWLMSVQPDGASPRQHVAAAAFALGSPAWAPDGHRMAYAHTVRGGARVTITETQGRAAQVIVDAGATAGTRVGWSPDGGRLVYVKPQPLPAPGGGTADWDMAVSRTTAGGGERVEFGLLAADPAWSPDGTAIAAQDLLQSEAVAVVPAGGSQTLLAAVGGLRPAWSPSGDRLLVVRAGDIWAVPVDGGPDVQLTSGSPVDADPAWSPDGTRIVFSRRATPAAQADLHVAAADGTGVHAITATPARDETQPDWGTADAVSPGVVIAAPADGAVIDEGAPLTAAYGCTDDRGPQAVADCAGPVPSGTPLDTSMPGDREFAVTAVDVAGNVTTVVHRYRVADRTPPAVTITPAGGTVIAGRPFTLTYSCDDGPDGSGVTLCEGPVPSGGTITPPRGGSLSVSVRARDAEGNERTAAVRLRARYAFGGFQAPVNATGWTPTRETSVIPLRFTLGGNFGLGAIDTDPANPAASWPRRVAIACDPVPRAIRIRRQPPGVFARGRPLLWAPTGLYTYELSARGWGTAGTCWAVFVRLDDDTVHRLNLWFV